LTGTKLAHQARAAAARGISYIFGKKFMHHALAARPRAFDSLPSQDPNLARCDFSSSAGSSKIKNRSSSRQKEN
jgi:hypothetical protein